MPRTVLEAMALAMPIIATYVDGIPELIEDGVSGRLFDPEDTSSMFEALISITSQADVACQFARAARQRYEIMFSRRKHIERARCMLAWLGARAQVPSAMTGQDYDREQP
jgi:glycosyltransferase involved in cell wall biosynthesis